MVRLHFTLADLTRVRLAREPYPLLETIFALQRLQGSEAGALFDGWRRQVWQAARRAEPPVLPRLLELVPHYGAIAGFLIPLAHAHDTPGWLEQVAATPAAVVRDDLRRYAELTSRPGGGWLRELAEGGQPSRTALVAALRGFLQVGLEPVWEPAAASVAADRVTRSRDLLDGGLEGLFTGLAGVASWQPPTLVTTCPADLDIELAGRGLVLVPSYFCWPWPMVLHDRDSGQPPLLIYPVRHRQLPAAGPGNGGQPRLAAALGRTRAAILELVASSPSTSELARRLRLSPPTVSWHLAALREAGLVSTRRNRSATHSLTSAGAHLLDQAGEAPAVPSSSNLWTATPVPGSAGD